MRRCSRGARPFIIAHRLSTIKSCDKIMYIADRHIQECGSHEELMARRGLYYKLYTAQSQEQGVLPAEEPDAEGKPVSVAVSN